MTEQPEQREGEQRLSIAATLTNRIGSECEEKSSEISEAKCTLPSHPAQDHEGNSGRRVPPLRCRHDNATAAFSSNADQLILAIVWKGMP